MKIFWKSFFVFVIACALLASFFIYKRYKLQSPPQSPKTEVTYSSPDNKNSNDGTANTTKLELPNSLLIKVPFTPQAPTANWDELHNEACEEVSAIMANAYFNKVSSLSPQTVEDEISKLTEWQKENQGYYLDQTTAETAKMIESVYNLHTEIIELDKNKIKQALADNKLVLVSTNGRLLHNPHYKQPGPIHHMLVLIGWTKEDKIITNDSGTKFGENYQYEFSTIQQASGDWTHSTKDVDTNKKLAIIVSK